MLNYIYQVSDVDTYQPESQDINKDVLRLAQNFHLPGLAELATRWMAQNLTTSNVVECLTTCEEFGLDELRGKILAQLTMNKKALFEVAGSPQIMKNPRLMQILLQQAAAVPGS